MITKQEIITAFNQYDSTKYSEEFYEYFLHKVYKSIEPDENLKDCVKYLILWFLGKVTTIKAEASVDRVFVKDKIYYLSRTTPNNDNAIEKALDEAHLWAGLSFKNNHLPYENFIKYANNITKNSIILPSFYVHIFKPNDYPIMNDKVWKVYVELTNKSVYLNTKPTLWSHYHQYCSLCSYLRKTHGLTFREIDKGFFVLGNQLKNKVRDEEETISNQLTFDGMDTI